MRRFRSILTAPVMAAALALPLVLFGPSGTAAAATDRLPDLGMARFADLSIQKTSDGKKLLRFSSFVVNVGAGNFEVEGHRASGATTMSVHQHVFDDAGGSRNVYTNAVAYFAGDGHRHWHVRNLERFRLIRLDNGKLVGTGAKHGFCFYDNWNYGATTAAFYTTASGACGASASDTGMTMGLSTDWGDKYGYTLPDQYIDITGLTAGRYRLRGIADASNWFVESNDSNNYTWVDLHISGTSVSVVRWGPQA